MEGVAYAFNKLLRTDSINCICDLYTDYKKIWKLQLLPGSFQPGRDTLRTFVKYVTERSRQKSCLSYFYVRLIETFAMYELLITQCEKDQTEALRIFDRQFPSPEMQNAIRTKVVTPQVFMTLNLTLTRNHKPLTLNLKPKTSPSTQS